MGNIGVTLSQYLPAPPKEGETDQETIANLTKALREMISGIYEYDQQLATNAKLGFVYVSDDTTIINANDNATLFLVGGDAITVDYVTGKLVFKVGETEAEANALIGDLNTNATTTISAGLIVLTSATDWSGADLSDLDSGQDTKLDGVATGADVTTAVLSQTVISAGKINLTSSVFDGSLPVGSTDADVTTTVLSQTTISAGKINLTSSVFDGSLPVGSTDADLTTATLNNTTITGGKIVLSTGTNDLGWTDDQTGAEIRDASGWAHGSDTTTINGGSIYAGSDITVGSAALSGTITIRGAAGAGDSVIRSASGGTPTVFGLTQAGFVLGFDDADDTYKFEIGSTTEHLKWDGTNLTIRGSLTAEDITAGTISTDRLVIADLDTVSCTDLGDAINAGTITGTVIIAGSLAVGSATNSGTITLRGGDTYGNVVIRSAEGGTPTDFNLAQAGFILGFDDTDNKYKFEIGSTTEHMKWDGTNLTITGTKGKIGSSTDFFDIDNSTLQLKQSTTNHYTVVAGGAITVHSAAARAGTEFCWFGYDVFNNMTRLSMRPTGVGVAQFEIDTTGGTPLVRAAVVSGEVDVRLRNAANTVYLALDATGTLNAFTLTSCSIAASQVDSGTMDGARISGGTFGTVNGSAITDISGSNVSGGTFGAVNGSAVTNINGSNVSGGTFGAVNGSAITDISGSNVSGGTFGVVNGSALTALNASNLVIGTVADGLLNHSFISGEYTGTAGALTINCGFAALGVFIFRTTGSKAPRIAIYDGTNMWTKNTDATANPSSDTPIVQHATGFTLDGGDAVVNSTGNKHIFMAWK